MILVNDKWEQVRDLQDISKIIRENYNIELADELDRLIPEHTDEEYYELECELDDKDSKISALEDECSSLESENEDLENKIEKLENKIAELEE